MAILAAMSQLLAADSPQGGSKVDIREQEKKCGDAPSNHVAEIIYHNLDYKGRATAAEGCFKGEVADRDGSARHTPTGFSEGMDRGHLIANRFGGSNTKPENIVPLYWEVNQHDMTVAEDDVADRLNRGERVYYYVEAVYRDGVNDEYVPDSINIYVSSESGSMWYYFDNLP